MSTKRTSKTVTTKHALVVFKHSLMSSIHSVNDLTGPKFKVVGSTVKVPVNGVVQKGTIVTVSENEDVLIKQMKTLNICKFFGISTRSLIAPEKDSKEMNRSSAKLVSKYKHATVYTSTPNKARLNQPISRILPSPITSSVDFSVSPSISLPATETTLEYPLSNVHSPAISPPTTESTNFTNVDLPTNFTHADVSTNFRNVDTSTNFSYNALSMSSIVSANQLNQTSHVNEMIPQTVSCEEYSHGKTFIFETTVHSTTEPMDLTTALDDVTDINLSLLLNDVNFGGSKYVQIFLLKTYNTCLAIEPVDIADRLLEEEISMTKSSETIDLYVDLLNESLNYITNDIVKAASFVDEHQKVRYSTTNSLTINTDRYLQLTPMELFFNLSGCRFEYPELQDPQMLPANILQIIKSTCNKAEQFARNLMCMIFNMSELINCNVYGRGYTNGMRNGSLDKNKIKVIRHITTDMYHDVKFSWRACVLCMNHSIKYVTSIKYYEN